jgi:hypothetical protein
VVRRSTPGTSKTHDVREHTMPRRSPNGAEPRRTDHLENHSQTIDAEMRRESSKADPTAQRLGFTTAVPFKPHTPRSSLKGWLIGPRPAERAMRTYTSWGILVMPAASLVDKGKPDVSRGRKATGPTRSAGLPKRERYNAQVHQAPRGCRGCRRLRCRFWWPTPAGMSSPGRSPSGSRTL